MPEEKTPDNETAAQTSPEEKPATEQQPELTEEQLSEKALNNLGQQAQAVNQQLSQGVDKSQIDTLQKQVSGMSSIVNRWGGELGQMRKDHQQLVDNGYIDQSTSQPQQTTVQQPTADPQTNDRLGRIEQSLTQMNQNHQYDAAFNSLRDLQASDPVFKTQDDIQNIASNPGHQDYPIYQKMVHLDSTMAQRGWNGINHTQAWRLIKDETGQTAREAAQVQLDARGQVMQNIQRQTNAPQTLGDNEHQQVEGKVSDKLNTMEDYQKLSREDKKRVKEEYVEHLREEEKAFGF